MALAEPGALSNAVAGRVLKECWLGVLSSSVVRLSDNHSSESSNRCRFVLTGALVGLGFIKQSSELDSIKGAFVIRRYPSFSA